MKTVFRKLARELVIFIFIAGFLGAGIGMFHELEATKPSVTITPDLLPVVNSVPMPDGACVLRAPKETTGPGEIPSCPPWQYYQALRNGTATDEWQVRRPEGCQETPEQIMQRQTWAKARFEAGETSNREARPAKVAIFGVFGFGIGALAGMVLWVFYRGIRFAISG